MIRTGTDGPLSGNQGAAFGSPRLFSIALLPAAVIRMLTISIVWPGRAGQDGVAAQLKAGACIRRGTPVRLQSGLTIAPSLPHLLHRIRGPSDSTNTSSG